MQRTPVTSTNIAEIGYDQRSQTLEILFLNEMVYQYFDVPNQVFQGLERAGSKGQYLNQHIKGEYRYARV